MGCCGKKEYFEGKWYKHTILRNALIAALITFCAFFLRHLHLIPPFFEITAYCIAILIGGYHWSLEALHELLHEKKIGIEFLMMAATIGSVLLGMWDEAAFLVVLYAAAEGLEEYTFARTRASIRKLLELAPKEARIQKDESEVMVPAESLKVGDIFIVKPGESIPTDGIITDGRSSIDEAPVTGESMPVEKEKGQKVFAATINQDGVLKARVTTDFENNTISKMVHLVEEAREQKGKAQIFIEAFGEKYSPAVLITALLFLVIPLFFGAPFHPWAMKAVVLLVAAAPCALIMSTPVAIATGIGTAGRNGVLIKGGMHLENLGKIKAVAFDKTGTLTMGKPRVTDVIALAGNEENLLHLASSLERSSTHPLALAIIDKANERKVRYSEVSNFQNLLGAGIRGDIEGRTFYLGKPKLFEGMGIQTTDLFQVDGLVNDGKTVILVGTKEKVSGIIAFQDTIRPEAKTVIEKLHRLGVKTAMLTGDNEMSALAIAKQLGIDDVKADLKPEDKIKAVEELIKTYGPVAMIGDGINDAPALARASVGIAMGTAGTDAAIEAADVALMGDDLNKLVYALFLGKKARRISRQNIVFSIALLAVMIPLAVMNLITIAVAVIVHEGSEMLAVANGLRVARS